MNQETIILLIMMSAGIGLYFLYDKFVVPWLADRTVARIVANAKAGKPIQRDYKLEIVFGDKEFWVVSLMDGKKSPSIKWNEVEKAVAFKRDLWAVDQICVFISRSDNTGIELDEEMKNWSEFIDALPKFLPNCKPSAAWFLDVAFPAFAENFTELYNRSAESKPVS
jgi:hypothetical protein